jgi:hypothetical protein
MVITIEPVTDEINKTAMLWVREQVFEQEMGLTLGRLNEPDQSSAFHLLARDRPDKEPVAVLSVIDTSGDHQLHENYSLRFDPGARVARYSQLAVLKPYRGMNLSLWLILEAHSQFVIPGGFDYTWLLFDAERVASSSLCRWLAFTPSALAFQSEFGLSCSLVRDEHASCSKQAIRQTEQYLEQCSLLLGPGIRAIWESPV